MLDIKLIREHSEIVKKNLKKRGDFKKLRMLDELITHDNEWRRLLTVANEHRHERRVITNKIATLKKAGEETKKQIEKGRKLDIKISALEKQVKEHRQNINDILMRLPNLLHASVPIGRDKNDNKEIRVWSKPPILDFSPRDHLKIAKNLDLIDEERGAKVAGHGFFYLKNYLVMLDLALQRFAIDFMIKKGYQLIEPPFMLRRKPYEGVTDFSDFENVMYKVEGEDLYMIATAEHPLAAMFMDEVLLKETLPIKFVGVSACFRKEVGTHGKYTKCLFRMHQFSKIEQFIFCHPDDSWNFHEELQQNARFNRVTTSGLRESHVHDVIITKEAPNYRLE